MPFLPPEVHQAEGMLMGQLDAPIGTAIERLRALAACERRDLVDVALDVIAHRLRLSA